MFGGLLVFGGLLAGGASISKVAIFRTEKVAYIIIFEKALQCGIKPGIYSIYIHIDNPSNNYACGKLVIWGVNSPLWYTIAKAFFQ